MMSKVVQTCRFACQIKKYSPRRAVSEMPKRCNRAASAHRIDQTEVCVWNEQHGTFSSSLGRPRGGPPARGGLRAKKVPRLPTLRRYGGMCLKRSTSLRSACTCHDGNILVSTREFTENKEKIPYLVAEISKNGSIGLRFWDFKFNTEEQILVKYLGPSVLIRQRGVIYEFSGNQAFDFIVCKKEHADKLHEFGVNFRVKSKLPPSPWIEYTPK